MRHLLLRFILISAFLGCGGKKEDDTSGAPAIPSFETLAMDLSSQGGSDLGLRDSQKLWQVNLLGANNNQARATVGVWSVAVAFAVAVPIAAIKAATSQTPAQQDDGSWLWRYDTQNAAGKTWSIALTGTPFEGSVDWSMRVTSSSSDSNGCCEDFEWLRGTSTGNGSGSWTIRDHTNVDAVSPVFNVTYTVTSATDKNIRYSKVAETGTLPKDSYVEFIRSGDQITFTSKRGGEGGAAIVTWNAADRSGSINPSDSSQVLCWNSNLEDSPCPGS